MNIERSTLAIPKGSRHTLYLDQGYFTGIKGWGSCLFFPLLQIVQTRLAILCFFQSDYICTEVICTNLPVGLSSFTPFAETVANETCRAQLVLAEHYALPTAASQNASISKHHWLSCLQGSFLFSITVSCRRSKKWAILFDWGFSFLVYEQSGWEAGKGSDPNWAYVLFELSLSSFQVCA